MADHRHGNHPVIALQANAAHAGGIAALEHPHFRYRKADGAARIRDQHDIVILGTDARIYQLYAFGQLHGDFAVGFDIGKIRQGIAAHIASRGGKEGVQIIPFGLVAINRHDRRDRNAGLQRQDIHNRLALRGARPQRQAPCFQLIHHAIGGEEQQLRVGIGHKQVGHHIVVFGLHPRQALAAAALGAEIAQGRAFDIARLGDRHHHVFALDQVFIVHIAGPIDNLGAARHGKLVFDLLQLGADDAHDPLARGQNFQVFLDLGSQFFQLVCHLFHAQLGQALQAQIQNGAGLNFRQVIGAIVVHRMGRIIDQPDEGGNFRCRPAARHQLFARLCRIGRGPDGGNHLVDI